MAKAGTAAFLIELENKRAIKVFGKSTFIGLAITFFAELCFSLISPLVNLAANDQWHVLKEGVPHLTVYTSFFCFSASSFVIAVVLNITFLYKPILNLPKSSFKAYLGDWDGRVWALLAGLLCGLRNGLQFMGGQAVGCVAADAVQVIYPCDDYGQILILSQGLSSHAVRRCLSPTTTSGLLLEPQISIDFFTLQLTSPSSHTILCRSSHSSNSGLLLEVEVCVTLRISIFSGGFLFDLNKPPSHFQEISETEHDSIEQQIDEELVHASETNGNFQTPS